MSINITRAHRLYPDSDDTSRGLLFIPTTCETCGGPTMSANSLTVLEINLNPILRVIPRVSTRPADEYYSDELDQCVCDNCA